MKLRFLIIPVIIILFSFYNDSYALTNKKRIIPDSIQKMSFEELDIQLANTNLPKEVRTNLVEAYYNKAKKLKNPHYIANAYYLKARLPRIPKLAYQYIDSIITLTKGTTNKIYPAKAYLLKSEFLIIEGKKPESLKTILIAENIALKNKNYEQLAEIKKYIAIIETDLGKFRSALNNMKAYQSSVRNKGKLSKDYLYATLIVSDIHNRLKEPDLALEQSNIVLPYLKKENPFLRFYIMFQGISYHLKKEYKKSNALFLEAIKYLKDKDTRPSLTISYYYIGKNILSSEKNLIKAKDYFDKADSILKVTKAYNPDIRDNYIQLIEIANKISSDKEKLYYLNRLITIDSTLYKEKVILAEDINTKYKTPHLLVEKENIINKIEFQKNIITTVSVLFLIVLCLAIYNVIKVRKQKKMLEKRYQDIMQNEKIEAVFDNKTFKEIVKPKTIDIPEVIIAEIEKHLIAFEKSNKFLVPQITMTVLAKEFGSNGVYLSKVVNFKKGKNFKKYLNDLRIDYAIQKLKKDKTFRKYTIKAIAEEVGFITADSFSNAFTNRTGFQPSSFIKKMEIEDEIN